MLRQRGEERRLRNMQSSECLKIRLILCFCATKGRFNSVDLNLFETVFANKTKMYIRVKMYVKGSKDKSSG